MRAINTAFFRSSLITYCFFFLPPSWPAESDPLSPSAPLHRSAPGLGSRVELLRTCWVEEVCWSENFTSATVKTQLVEPLWTDPDLKSGTGLRELIST